MQQSEASLPSDTTACEPGYDLHTHSTVSDGTTSPEELVAEVAAQGLTGFALTDHDTMAGWEAAREAAAAHGVDFVPGLEITTKFHGVSVHLLGYGCNVNDASLTQALSQLRNDRDTRAERMFERLSKDFALDWSDLRAERSTTLGRPHLADALVRRGYAHDRSEVFARILAPGSPYYLPSASLDTADAIALVRGAGGVAVIAHPAAVRQRHVTTDEELSELTDCGLSGVEVFHPENRPEEIIRLHRTAVSLGLAVTGSSDYHGTGKPNRLGQCVTPPQTVSRLRERMHTPR